MRPGSLDAEIDSLTSMLAELDGGRGPTARRPERQVSPKSALLAPPCTPSSPTSLGGSWARLTEEGKSLSNLGPSSGVLGDASLVPTSLPFFPGL